MTPLRKKMIDDMVLRGLAASTQDADVRAVSDLATFYRKSPEGLSSQDVQRFLLHLYQERGMAPMSVNRVLFGLRFFYHQTLERERTSFRLPCARRPSKLPEILSREEVMRLFTVTENLKHRTLLKTAYAAGLRHYVAVAHDLPGRGPENFTPEAIAPGARSWRNLKS